jgi:hypothetical protein
MRVFCCVKQHQFIRESIAPAGIASALSDPGKPWQNGADAGFNGTLRDECVAGQGLPASRRQPCRQPTLPTVFYP